jgi:hypothetical protein
MSARKSPHLLETFNGHQRSQRLAFPFDDELVVSQSNTIQQVPDSLTQIHRRYAVGH